MTQILSRHKNVNERFIIEIYNEEMFLFLKEKNIHLNFSCSYYIKVGMEEIMMI